MHPDKSPNGITMNTGKEDQDGNVCLSEDEDIEIA
jgi:hypothetical protein